MSDPVIASDSYRELFERSADAILIIEGERFVECNEATVRMLRAESRAQVMKTHPSELSPPTQPDGRNSREKANEMMATAMRAGNHRFEWVHRRVDGSDFPVEVLLTMVPRKDGHRLHVVWRDISNRRRLEDELRHTQKMEAIGKLTGGIAHDFNNLLVAILGHAELLAYDLHDQPDLLARVREIRSAGDRAADLVRQLMLFGRKGTQTKTVFNLGALLLESQRLLERVLGEDVQLAIAIESPDLRVEADSTQIQQVVLNLASNARDAMPTGGHLSLRLRRTERHGDEIGANAIPPGAYAEFSVSDTGQGMDEETARRAFDPFFTTKEVGRGTGLGLATVHGVVDRAGGRVSVYSALGEGTTFKILLPLVDAPLSASIAEDTAPLARGDETLLVVEDERATSTLVVAALEAAGYRVLLARNGQEGLQVFDQHRSEIALVLSDVIMPQLGGPELLRQLAERGDRPRTLLMSGYTGDALERGGGLLPDEALLEKPFSPSELLRRVRAALDA